ncbi:SH3 domain-containing protein [Pseudorhodobacter sp.]|uniref:SH3 domain-containing protein n=1 Tax=Pseudorhodobacter sp. TaxID=1934400 RepID=UPI002649029E|nr:SH3 domain-containing protein [Pseudorhodobacter sp.]MDN5786427.1 SH3 domain-containing protein [Pseudorhodobacter sp.]
MKLLLAALFSILFTLGAAAQTLYVKQTHDGFLNLRSGPGVQFDILQRMSPGDRVEVLESKGTWRRVQHQDGRTGWTSGKYLAPGLIFGQILKVVQTSDGYLNLRTGPGSGYSILRRIYPGDRVRLLDAQGAWRKVALGNDLVGWAHGRYLTE